MFFKVYFLNFRYFFFYTCKHINLSDEVNYSLFITKCSHEHDYCSHEVSESPLQVVPFRNQTLDVLKPQYGAMLRSFHYCFTKICDVYNEEKNLQKLCKRRMRFTDWKSSLKPLYLQFQFNRKGF